MPSGRADGLSRRFVQFTGQFSTPHPRETLGFALCRTAYLLCFVYMSKESFIIPNALVWFWSAATVTALVVATLFGAHRLKRSDGLFPFCAITLLSGIAASVCGSYVGETVLTCLGIALAGAGIATLLLQWGAQLTLLSNRDLFASVAWAMTIAAVLILAINQFVPFQGIVALVCTAGSLVALRSLPRPEVIGPSDPPFGRFATGRSPSGQTPPGQTPPGPTPLRESALRRFPLRPSSRPSPAAPVAGSGFDTGKLLGICLMMFVFPFAYHLAVMTFFDTTILNRDIEGLIVGAIFLLAIPLAGRANLERIYNVILPVMIAAYLFLQLLPASWEPFCIIAAGTGSKLSSVSLFIALVVFARDAPEKHRWVAASLGASAIFGGRAAAFILAATLTAQTHDPIVATYLLVVILVVTVLVVLPTGHTRPMGPLPDDVEHAGRRSDRREDQRPDLDTVIQRLAALHGLTPRETDVLSLLAQGRSKRVIAERLGITDGTAHVHIVHVYQKLDVHTQQEVITLIETSAQPGGSTEVPIPRD